jgi:hypothetical protein
MKRDFIKYIKTLDEKGLAAELQKLYSKFPKIKKYYEMELSPTTDKIVGEYKVKIKKEYFRPTSLGKARSGVSRQLISEFKKIAIYESDVIELWVYRTEMMAAHVAKRSYIKEALYNSLVSSYETTCKLIVKEKLEAEFEPRCRTVINTVYNYGWGLPDRLKEVYEAYFGKFTK